MHRCLRHSPQSYRPDYKSLNILRQQFAGVPIIGLTATATAHVIDDVKRMLGIPGAIVFRAPFNRANLRLVFLAPRLARSATHREVKCVFRYSVRAKSSNADEVVRYMADLCLNEFAGKTGIVYVLSRSDAETIALQLG